MQKQMSFGNKPQSSEMSQKKSTKKRGLHQVMLMNDNHNTVDHVVDCLMEICGHNYFQAVQCATITHGAKKWSIYVDAYESCEDVCEELLKEGLDVIIEKHKNNA